MRLSILVISRTPSLLSSLLASLAGATDLPGLEVEILCSWNGSKESETEIDNRSGYELLIAQREPYHFARNMNGLALKANGELLLLINDDVELDKGSIDTAIRCLIEHSDAGLIGGRLRDAKGKLIHAGILFDSHHSPYHQLDRQIAAEHHAVMGYPSIVPAVTGALMLMKREHFKSLKFQTAYKVCGEDIELCLDLRQTFKLTIWYCPDFSGRHDSESTRSQTTDQQGNSEDLTRMRQRRREFLDVASKTQLEEELAASITEAEALRSLETHRQNEGREISELLSNLKKQKSDLEKQKSKLEKQKSKLELTDYPDHPLSKKITRMKKESQHWQRELQHWRQQSHSLQLTRLRLEKELQEALKKSESTSKSFEAN